MILEWSSDGPTCEAVRLKRCKRWVVPHRNEHHRARRARRQDHVPIAREVRAPADGAVPGSAQLLLWNGNHHRKGQRRP